MDVERVGLRRAGVAIGLSLALGTLGLVWAGVFESEIATGLTPKPIAPTTNAAAELGDARRACSVAALDRFIEQQRARIESTETDAEQWRILAEALLERSLARSQRRGMAIGRPLYTALPDDVRQDLDLGDAALQRARELGDASSESYRIEAALMTGRVTGWLSAMQIEGKVRQALQTAAELDPNNPRVAVALACRKLFRPIGGDPAAARADFLAAAAAMPHDERALVFASMAAFVTGDRAGAVDLARRAATNNRANAYAAEVLRRLEADEADPFGRDLD